LYKFWEEQNYSILNKIGIKLDKNNEHRDQIEYKTFTPKCGKLLDWHMDI